MKNCDARKLDLNNFKELYVRNKIEKEDFSILSKDIATGIVFKIKGFGTLNITGYEHGFLYLKAGSSIKKHKHTKDMEVYNIIENGRIIDSRICLLNDFHGIDRVEKDTIVETFKIDKKLINDIYDDNTLNKCMIIQLDRNLWRLNQILNLLSLEDYDIGWRSLDNIAYVYNVTIDIVESIKNIYFKGINNLPYLPLSMEEIRSSIEWKRVPYVIDDMYKLYDFDDEKEKKLIKK